uniref:Putative ribonuclease H-like domain-containing protein n=1 Tax=Tanacetum cinerariifolium TaxID=118510 RepID=A0A6L2NHD7_TANCI|nr:putative ribonuclease H-like domain-containing protein [Tanacetum cinerariifolium]
MHVNFLENKSNIAGSGPEWLFDIDSLTNSMNYQPVSVGIRTNDIIGSKIHSDAGQKGKEKVSDQEYILLPVLNASSNVPLSNEEVVSSPKNNDGKKSIVEPTRVEGCKIDDLGCLDQQMKSTDDFENTNSTNSFNIASLTVNTASDKDGTFQRTYGIHKAHPKEQIIGEVNSDVQTRKMAKQNEAGLVTFINKKIKTNHKDFQTSLSACFLSQMEPKKTTVDLPHGKKPLELNGSIETREIREGLFNHVILGLCILLDLTMYQMDVKSAFLYGTIEEEAYVSQPLGFLDPEFLDKVYKVEKALYGLYQAPSAWYETLLKYLLENGFRRGTIDKTLFIKKIKIDILLVQVYVDDIIFGLTKSVKSASTPMEKQKPLPKDSDGTNTKIHMDNESAICVVKNPVHHSKSKHIEIRHHFIRDSYKKRLIEMVKIHIDSNIADLLTKAFDVTSTKVNAARFSYCCWCNMLVTELILLVLSVLDSSTQQMVINSPCLTDKKELAIPGQMATGKELSNPLMAGSLPKNISAKEEGDRVERAITTYASLEATQDSDNIIKTQTTAMPNVDIPQGIDTSGRPRRQETMGGTSAQTRVTQLENELSTTKAVYNKAFITLTNRIKKLDSHLEQKRSSAVIHSSDEEGPKLAQKLYAEELAKEGARQEQERYNLEKALELQRQLDQRKENVPKGDEAKEID